MVDVFAVAEFEGGLFSAGSFVPVCIVTILPRRQPPLLSRYRRMSGVAVTSSRRCSLEVIRHDSRKGNFPSTSRGRDGKNASGTPKANARALDSWDCWRSSDRSRRIKRRFLWSDQSEWQNLTGYRPFLTGLFVLGNCVAVLKACMHASLTSITIMSRPGRAPLAYCCHPPPKAL